MCDHLVGCACAPRYARWADKSTRLGPTAQSVRRWEYRKEPLWNRWQAFQEQNAVVIGDEGEAKDRGSEAVLVGAAVVRAPWGVIPGCRV